MNPKILSRTEIVRSFLTANNQYNDFLYQKKTATYSELLSNFIYMHLEQHLRNLLTHELLFLHFLEDLNFKLKNTLEYIRAMFSGNAWLFS